MLLVLAAVAASGPAPAAEPAQIEPQSLECVDEQGNIELAAENISRLQEGDVTPKRTNWVQPTPADESCVAPRVPLLVFEGVVDTSGSVCALRLVKPEPSCFTEPFATALRKTRFTPAERNGRKLPVYMNWTVNVHLQ
ncbi:MAG: hypothetical protein AB7G12_09580 [Thermoanaerobaculia bacterium]